MKFKSFEIHMNFICISCEILMSLMSTSLALHGYNISTSLVIRCKVHMNFIRTAYKFIWIYLISFDTKFINSSFELHTKLIWSSREFHMNKLDFISYEIHEKFIWTSYEARMKLTMNFDVVQTNFLWSYGYMVSYGLHMNEPPGPSYKRHEIYSMTKPTGRDMCRYISYTYEYNSFHYCGRYST